jgi:PAP2 superfamily
LLTLSTRDVFISCWYSKYTHNLQRPVTYIREVIGARDWNSPVPTPPYPDYTSGTSCNAGSSSTILTQLFGAREFTDNQHADKNFTPRTYKNFREAAIDAYHSRIYGGVHMRRACEKGMEQGACVADYLIRNLKFETR